MAKRRNKIEKSIRIKATRERIWAVLLGPETFKDWCSAFNPGSTFEGDWSVGSSMRFLGPDEEGNLGGILTKVIVHEPNERIRCEHFGVISDGKDLFEGEAFDMWIPSVEEYRLSGGPAVCTLSIANEVPDSFWQYFEDAWDKCLKRIKELAEAS